MVLAPAAAQAAPTAGVLAPAIQCANVLASGAQTAKFLVKWSDLQQAPLTTAPGVPVPAGIYNTTLIQDRRNCFSALKTAGISVFVVIYGTPGWANQNAGETAPPDPAYVGQFQSLMTQLTKAGPPTAVNNWHGFVTGYMIWNEADGPTFWNAPGGPNAANYVPLLKAGYAGVKAGDPSALVGFSTLTGGDDAFLQAAYAAEPNLNNYFDAVPVDADTACSTTSPYSYYRVGTTGPIGQTSFLAYRNVHDALVAHGKDAPIWLELGWSTSSALCNQGASKDIGPGGVSPDTQALYLRQAQHCLKQDPYVSHAWWFYLRDDPTAGPVDDSFGLQTADGSPKPAVDAFRSLLAGNDTLTGDCGDFTPPSVQITSPVPNTYYAGPLPLAATASDPSGVTRVSIDVDGQRIRSYPKAPDTSIVNDAPLDNGAWSGGNDLPAGPHTILARATDVWGNVSTTTRIVNKVDLTKLKGTARIVLDKGTSPRRLKSRTYAISGSIAVDKLTSGVGLTGPIIGIVPQGKVRVAWSYSRTKIKKVKGKKKKVSSWVVLHGSGGYANHPFAFTQKLRYKGKWRVKVSYMADAPFASTATKYLKFTAR